MLQNVPDPAFGPSNLQRRSRSWPWRLAPWAMPVLWVVGTTYGMATNISDVPADRLGGYLTAWVGVTIIPPLVVVLIVQILVIQLHKRWNRKGRP